MPNLATDIRALISFMQRSRVHYTWLFAFMLIAWSLAQGYFPFSSAGLGAGTYWILGVVSALLLFGSVLVHELGHSLLAARWSSREDDLCSRPTRSRVGHDVALLWSLFLTPTEVLSTVGSGDERRNLTA
jgi:Zn-dependent protease